MKCLATDEIPERFGRQGFSVPLYNACYGSALVLDAAKAANQTRVAGRPPSGIEAVPAFGRALNRWLPSGSDRLLWVAHWEEGTYGSDHAIVAAARAGQGETRSLDAAPGFLFDAHHWAEEDQLDVSRDMAQALGMLAGLIGMVMSTSSDAWLISSSSSDRIEFWEGNILFYSEDRARCARAEALLAEFQCPRDLM